MNAKTLEDLQAELARQDAEFAELEEMARKLPYGACLPNRDVFAEIEAASEPPTTAAIPQTLPMWLGIRA